MYVTQIATKKYFATQEDKQTGILHRNFPFNFDSEKRTL